MENTECALEIPLPCAPVNSCSSRSATRRIVGRALNVSEMTGSRRRSIAWSTANVFPSPEGPAIASLSIRSQIAWPSAAGAGSRAPRRSAARDGGGSRLPLPGRRDRLVETIGESQHFEQLPGLRVALRGQRVSSESLRAGRDDFPRQAHTSRDPAPSSGPLIHTATGRRQSRRSRSDE
jgi:hypothetical protein